MNWKGHLFFGLEPEYWTLWLLDCILVLEISYHIGEYGLGLELDDGLLFGKHESLLVCGVTSVADDRIQM